MSQRRPVPVETEEKLLARTAKERAMDEIEKQACAMALAVVWPEISDDCILLMAVEKEKRKNPRP